MCLFITFTILMGIQKRHGVGVVKVDVGMHTICHKRCVITTMVGLKTTSVGGFEVQVNSGYDLLSNEAMLGERRLDHAYVDPRKECLVATFPRHALPHVGIPPASRVYIVALSPSCLVGQTTSNPRCSSLCSQIDQVCQKCYWPG